MPDFNLIEFEKRLRRSGIAARHIHRACLEIQDHLDDLHADARAQGMNDSEARAFATRSIGELDVIVDAMSARSELRTWTCRFPRLACFCLPLAYVALLPVTPIIAGVARAPQIARWATCAMLGALVTATMFLAMQLSIALS